MKRIPDHRWVPEIELALRVTAGFHWLTGVPDFLCGIDPVFAGLHSYETIGDGRSYRDTAHCVYAHQLTTRPRSDRRTTIVLPTVEPWWVVVHEYGHVLDEALRFEIDSPPVSNYAKTNRYESFAEAFTSHLTRGGYWARTDPQTAALLDSLRWRHAERMAW